ncbi:hypothetical protein [Paracoccus sp. PARArs4]|uniref:hypothetical protein n=1 Tax=Paracoccus sp. PARArs4 TaxID=2853442 RepID=UPI0024A65040|nr:hypothetical protein [Paracoccus sp. PARArs4]
MPPFDSLIGLLDSRSFSTVWFWILQIGAWSVTGRTVLGVPVEIVARARAAHSAGQAETPEALTLLDWLSLTLPRWRLGPREGAIFLGVTSFLLSSGFVLGFNFGLELAQAAFLLALPFWLLFWMRVRLARKLAPMLVAAQEGRAGLADTVGQVARSMAHHRIGVIALSLVSLLVTMVWGMLWIALHPMGF